MSELSDLQDRHRQLIIQNDGKLQAHNLNLTMDGMARVRLDALVDHLFGEYRTGDDGIETTAGRMEYEVRVQETMSRVIDHDIAQADLVREETERQARLQVLAGGPVPNGQVP